MCRMYEKKPLEKAPRKKSNVSVQEQGAGCPRGRSSDGRGINGLEGCNESPPTKCIELAPKGHKTEDSIDINSMGLGCRQCWHGSLGWAPFLPRSGGQANGNWYASESAKPCKLALLLGGAMMTEQDAQHSPALSVSPSTSLPLLAVEITERCVAAVARGRNQPLTRGR